MLESMPRMSAFWFCIDPIRIQKLLLLFNVIVNKRVFAMSRMTARHTRIMCELPSVGNAFHLQYWKEMYSHLMLVWITLVCSLCLNLYCWAIKFIAPQVSATITKWLSIFYTMLTWQNATTMLLENSPKMMTLMGKIKNMTFSWQLSL